MMSTTNSKVHGRRTFLGYVLSSHQDAIVNYLIPSVASLLLYIFLFASDVAVVFRHFKDNNPIWASLTIFIVCLPSLCAYVVIISSWDLWPEKEGCERKNCIWFIVKTLSHILFPVWAMWRYAERIFWSIEAVRSNDDEFVAAATGSISAPRTIELYFFFQAFLHSLPQMLLQLNILMRQDYQVNKQTADAEIMSFVFNLCKLAATVAFYQRFKTQKLAGKQYPWFKSYKHKYGLDLLDGPIKKNTEELPPSQPLESRPLSLDTDEPPPSESRRSSDFYLEPEIRQLPLPARETSIVDGPLRTVYRQEISEPDFNIKRTTIIKGLPEDDLAGKLISFCWWSCFLLARVLAIAAFFFFYQTATVWLMVAHFLLMMAFLIYDVKSDQVKRAKAVFFIFIALIYLFCIIEFKIKFKKTKFMYIGYFSLVFLENFVMCLVWWSKNVEDLQSDFWFRYIFYIVILGSLFSVSSMLLYLSVNKPEKIVVGEKVLD